MKKYYLVLDTETCGSLETPLPYDIGFLVADRLGNVYEKHSYVCADIFCDLTEEVKTAYYAEKIPMYWDDLKSGKRILKTAYNIRKSILDVMKRYKINEVVAYNADFDKRAMNNLVRWTTKSKFRYFFPYGTKYICIWNMCCQTILNSRNYFKFATENGLINENSGNVQTNAEACYKYVTRMCDFEESHTALEDCEIEVALFAKCLATKKKINRGINRCCWRIPNKKFKEQKKKKGM